MQDEKKIIITLFKTFYLVNSTWNEAMYVCLISKYLWERAAEGWSCLHGWKGNFSNAI